MTNPLHARWYADHALQVSAPVCLREELAHETWLVRIDCADIAQRIMPGQFVMVRDDSTASDPLLGRAFAMYDVVADELGGLHYLDIVFHEVGKMTHRLACITEGERLSVCGPLGNGFDPIVSGHANHVIMVAGGIGQTPFLAVAKELLGHQEFGRSVTPVDRVTLCYGARSAAHLAGVDHFRRTGVEVRLATDDGSAGHHGFVTDLLCELLDAGGDEEDSVRVVCCGPEPMMGAVAEICHERAVACQVSLETPMACGLGICFSCVTRVRQADGSWDFKRTCVDGPVFQADDIVW